MNSTKLTRFVDAGTSLAVQLMHTTDYGDVPHAAQLDQLLGLLSLTLCQFSYHDNAVDVERCPSQILRVVEC